MVANAQGIRQKQPVRCDFARGAGEIEETPGLSPAAGALSATAASLHNHVVG